MNERMNEWMNDEWMNERTNEWMKERTNEWTKERMNERKNEWMNERTNERMNEWMNEWTKERMNEWIVTVVIAKHVEWSVGILSSVCWRICLLRSGNLVDRSYWYVWCHVCSVMFDYFMTTHWFFTVGIKPKGVHENMWIYYICNRKPPARFGRLLWPSSRRCFYDGYATKTAKPTYKHRMLSSEQAIHIMC